MNALLADLGHSPCAAEILLAGHAAEIAEQLRELEAEFAKREASPAAYDLYVRQSGNLRRHLRELANATRVAA
jgi:hypothetical protein